MHKKLSEKLGAKFPAITRGLSMVNFVHLDNAFLEVFFLTANKPIRRPNTAAKRKEKGKRKSEKKNNKIIKKRNLERRRALYFLVSSLRMPEQKLS